jgi:hypothetical protein
MTTTPPPASISPSSDEVTPTLEAEWQRVAVCEEGGDWSYVGPVYSGIGFLNTTWDSEGGLAYAPNAGEATEDEQITIGMRITGGYVPDQGYCASW